MSPPDRLIHPSPLEQRLWKKLYKAFHDRRMRHNCYLWPYMKIQRDLTGAVGRICVAGTTVPLTPVYQALERAKDEFHIILSGPSIADIDYSHLGDLQLIGVNGSISLQDRFNIKFPFYCLIDDTFVCDQPGTVARIVAAPERSVFLTPSVLRYILQELPYTCIRCQLSVVENIVEQAFLPVATRTKLSQRQHKGLDIAMFDTPALTGFSFEPAAGWFDGATVAFAALHVAVWGAARRIYFHGLDITNASTQGRFYDQGEQRLATRLEDDFDAYIEPSFRHAIPLLRERGIDVFNLSPDSALDRTVIPYVDWRSLNGSGNETP